MVMPMTEDLLIIQVRASRKPYDYRCRSCGRLLFRAILPDNAYLEIRCPKCGRISVFDNDTVNMSLDVSLET